MATVMKRLRLFAALLLLAALVYIVDFRELLSAFANIRLIYVFYLILISLVLIAVSCLKWQLFIRAAGHDAGLGRLMKYYTMSYFFNMFLPSSLGGDLARTVQLGLHLKDQKSSLAVTFVERYTGFLAMNLIAVAFVAAGAKTTAGVEAAILGVAALTLLGGLVCFSEPLARFFFRIGIRILLALKLTSIAATLQRLFDKLIDSIAFAKNDLPLLAKAMLLSFAFHFGAVVNTYVCARAVGWDTAQFSGLCVVVPLVLLISAAPITPNSVGVQEGAFLYFLMRLGATQAEGLGVGIILRAKTLVTACVGGLIWLWDSSRKVTPAGAHG